VCQCGVFSSNYPRKKLVSPSEQKYYEYAPSFFFLLFKCTHFSPSFFLFFGAHKQKIKKRKSKKKRYRAMKKRGAKFLFEDDAVFDDAFPLPGAQS